MANWCRENGDPGKNFVLIMKGADVYKNTLWVGSGQCVLMKVTSWIRPVADIYEQCVTALFSRKLQ